MVSRVRLLRSVKITDWTTYSDTNRAFLEIEVQDVDTNELVIGIGQFGGKDIDAVLRLFFQRFVPAIMNITLKSPFELLDIVASFEFNYKMMGVQFAKALCGIDTALWDALAKFEEKTVVELVSSKPLAWIPVYASSISRDIDTNSLIGELKRLTSTHGIMSFKIKIGERMAAARFPSSNDFELINEALDSLPKCKVAVDCNGGFSDFSSLRPLQEYFSKLWFIEEPFPWYQYSKYEELRENISSICLAGGEQEFRRDVLHDKVGLFDLVQPDVGYSGGFTELLLLSEKSKAVYPHTPQNDLLPVVACHFLSSGLQQENVMELGCVRDGLVQVDLDDNGLFKPTYFNEYFCVKNGAFTIKGRNTGWGISLSLSWKETARTKTYESYTEIERSFL